MSELFDRIVRDAMAKLGWSRTNAEKVAKRVVETSVANAAKAEATAAKRARRAERKKRKRMAAIPPLKAAKAPKTAKERIERALGPDDGPRRGGSPFVQGGSPGLGRRR